jgi:hypothetical protein
LDLKVDDFLISNMHLQSSFDFYLSKWDLARCFCNIYDYFHFWMIATKGFKACKIMDSTTQKI